MPVVAIALTRKFGPAEIWRVSMASTHGLQLLTNEFRDHLPVDTLPICPLDDVIRDFHGKLHVERILQVGQYFLGYATLRKAFTHLFLR